VDVIYEDKKIGSKQKTIIVLLIIVLAATAVIAWWLWGRQEPLPDGLILTNGRIEGDHYTVAGKMSGRIVQLLAREGDFVTKGQILLTLDNVQIQARVDQAQAAVHAAEALLHAARVELAVLRKTVPLEIETAEAGVAHAKAAAAAANVSKKQAAHDAGRYRELARIRAASRETSEHSDLQLKVAQEDFAVAQAALIQAKKQLAEKELGSERIKAAESRVSAQEAQLQQTKAALAEAQSVLEDMTIYCRSRPALSQMLCAWKRDRKAASVLACPHLYRCLSGYPLSCHGTLYFFHGGVYAKRGSDPG